jgi:UDP-N-acetylmuramate--alanine ligase
MAKSRPLLAVLSIDTRRRWRVSSRLDPAQATFIRGHPTLSASTLCLPRHFDAVRTHTAGRVRLVGIAGSGMRALACVLDSAGWIVGGSDPRCADLPMSRFKITKGHSADAIDASLDLVVYSEAVPADNPELARARQLGLKVISYPQMLGQLMQSRTGVAIAGTHGKSTTTAMAGQILSLAGQDPTVIYGATAVEARWGSRLGRGRWMLAEACEYRASFRHLKPRIAVILNIELDHCDCFGSLAEVEGAFAGFAGGLAAEGLVLVSADCDAARRAVAEVGCPVETFGLCASATWQATAPRQRRGLYSFELRAGGRLVCEVKMAVRGLHNVRNALAAAAVASHCGATGSAIRQGLERFAGLGRRLQIVADDGSIAVVDDYAHHPTEVAAALATVRQMYPGRRLWCVFQPHQASRTARFLDGFARSLHNADKLIVADIYRAREKPHVAGEVTAAELADRVGRRGREAVHVASAGEITRRLEGGIEPGDVLVTLGAGDIGAIAHAVGQRFRTIRKAG